MSHIVAMKQAILGFEQKLLQKHAPDGFIIMPDDECPFEVW